MTTDHQSRAARAETAPATCALWMAGAARDLHDPATLAVTRCLDSQEPEVRKDAAYLRQAAEKGADIRPALPRLKLLARQRDSSRGRWARSAIDKARKRQTR